MGAARAGGWRIVPAAAALAGCMSAAAEPGPSWHLFSGFDASGRSAFAHQGMVWAPFGDLHAQGWQMRAVASHGGYLYQRHGVDTRGRMMALEAMTGYRLFWDDRGATVSAGFRLRDHSTSPADPDKRWQGLRGGPAVLAEGWLRVRPDTVVSASAGYAAPGRGYSARLALAWEGADGVVFEPEIAAFGEPGYDQIRVALYTELHRSQALVVRFGAGWAFDGDGDGPYVGIQIKAWEPREAPRAGAPE